VQEQVPPPVTATSTEKKSVEAVPVPNPVVEVSHSYLDGPFFRSLSSFVTVFALLFLFVFVVSALYLRLTMMRKHLKKDIKNMATVTHTSFKILRDEVDDHIKKLKAAGKQREENR